MGKITKVLSCLVVIVILMSAVPAVVAEDAPDRSNEIPPEFQNRTSSSEAQDTYSTVQSAVDNVVTKSYYYDPPYDPTIRYMHKDLKEMINDSAGDYYNDRWNISLSQYKSWIALISLMEAGNLRYGAHSSSLGKDKFYHVAVGKSFPFSTGIGVFQLDRGGEGGGENWSVMPTIDKINPEKALISTLRWHKNNSKFGDGATLANFSRESKWFGVKDGYRNEPVFRRHWNLTTGYTWDESKDAKIDVAFHPPITDRYPYDEVVKDIGDVYWNLSGWKGCFKTWLISAKTWQDEGVYSYKYYYAKNDSREMWVWNSTNPLIYRYARNYDTAYLPENLTGNYAGFSDDEAALNLSKPCFSLDLIFAIDTTGSMWDDIDEVKADASAIVDEVLSDIPGARIAVVDYKDFPVSPYGGPTDYPFHDVLPFSTDRSSIIAAINSLGASGGADWRESVYSALMHSIDSTSLGGWRGSDQAAKVIILMGDAPPHDPEPFTGYTLSSVVTAAENADPVIIYPVQIGGTVENFEELANQTGGKAFTAEDAGEVVDAILDAIEEIKTKPVADANGPYLGYVGCPITFDGTGSYDLDGTIVSYEWDFDDDGEFDDATGATLSKTWNSAYFGNIRLKVTDNDGNEDVDSTTVTVREQVAIETATGTGTAYFASDSGTIKDLIALNEYDLPEENPIVEFPHGLFGFNITGLTPGQNVTLIVTFPSAIPTTSQYWKCGPNGSVNNPQPERWYQIPMGSNDGDNIITIALQDGGIGDDDGVANGVIVDQGGPGVPTGVARVPTLTPVGIIALAGLLAVVAVSRMRRKR